MINKCNFWFKGCLLVCYSIQPHLCHFGKWHQTIITYWAVQKKRTSSGSISQSFLEALIIWKKKIPGLAVKETCTQTHPQSLYYISSKVLSPVEKPLQYEKMLQVRVRWVSGNIFVRLLYASMSNNHSSKNIKSSNWRWQDYSNIKIKLPKLQYFRATMPVNELLWVTRLPNLVTKVTRALRLVTEGELGDKALQK